MDLKGFWRDERGASSIEYGSIAALVAIVLVASIRMIGNNLNTLFLQKLASNLT